VDAGCAAADAPLHAATAQTPTSALAVRNVFLIMLPSMRPASGWLTNTVTFEAIGVNEKDMKLARPGRQNEHSPGRERALVVVAPPVDTFLHVAVMVFP
jgi:hypothetical protein